MIMRSHGMSPNSLAHTFVMRYLSQAVQSRGDSLLDIITVSRSAERHHPGSIDKADRKQILSEDDR